MDMDKDKEIISKLKFIGRIKKGEKIDTHHMTVQRCGIITSIIRTAWYQDNRNNTLNFIQTIIESSFDVLQKFTNQSDERMINYMITDLKGSKNGIDALKETYVSDLKFCCDLDTIVQLIDTRLS